ncbi:hypothetical protein [Acinetobacter baumannii]|nr:hypothetical protein [Acinetobacter baumannii]
MHVQRTAWGMKNHSIGSEYWPSSMANAAACRKGPSGENSKPPI